MNLAISLLPVGLMAGGQALKDKDANETGADDAMGSILLALAPLSTDIVHGSVGSGNATLKAMRLIENIAHSYRVQVSDPTLGT